MRAENCKKKRKEIFRVVEWLIRPPVHKPVVDGRACIIKVASEKCVNDVRSSSCFLTEM
jgi:hypothetical protein